MTVYKENPAFIGDDEKCDGDQKSRKNSHNSHSFGIEESISLPEKEQPKERDTWGNGLEFLMSCIAMSVGLGNVWRFPFTALENGGGAFLIPYLIVLFLIGKPIYYVEMIIGQFSSRGSVKVFDLCPAMRGVGIGQTISISFVTTYYVAIMGITLFYLFQSFKSPLPWEMCRDNWDVVCIASGIREAGEEFFGGVGMGQAFMVFLLATYYESICAIISYYLVQSFRNPLPWAYCRPEWDANCFDSTPRNWLWGSEQIENKSNNTVRSETTSDTRLVTSSELFFVKEVLREKENINDGIGDPNWELVIGLFIAWICVFSIISRGVKSSGKASYFLAIFPYVIMFVLLIRAVTLPGAADGILYFIKPNWGKILDPQVWYAAVTQCFYSLSVCFGNIIMYASYNKFRHNVHRDALIVTSLDTCTSLLAGFTIFGILGHLAHETGATDIGTVVKGGTGLAFISYPDAIAKFRKLPQIFSVLFFLMLFILGIGSNIAMTSCTVTAIRDNFPKIKQWHCAMGIAIISFCIGLTYITPGGQFILTLVDFFGASMIALALGIVELYVLGWVYGTNRLCKDAEFMMGRKIGLYWRLCWSIITPLIMTMIFIYFLATYEPLMYNNVRYPNWAYALGWSITAFGILQVPIWFCVAVIRAPGSSFWEKVRVSFQPKHDWGPSDPVLREQYYKERATEELSLVGAGYWSRIKRNIFG